MDYIMNGQASGDVATRLMQSNFDPDVLRPYVGDDGRTYIAERSLYGHITIMQGTMKFQHEVVHENDPRHAELLALFAEVGP